MAIDRSFGAVLDRPGVRSAKRPGPSRHLGNLNAAGPALSTMSPGQLMALQRSVGNAAVAGRLTAHTSAASRQPVVPVQRDGPDAPMSSEPVPTADQPNQSLKNTPTAKFEPGKPIADASVATTVEAIIAAMGSTATTVIPYQPPSVASADGTGSDMTAQASAIPSVVQQSGALDAVQRSGGGGGAHAEGGITASGQVCYNLCTGEVTLVGWIWAGAGVKVWGNWFGAFYFWEGSRVIGQLDHIQCGTCSPACGGGEKKHEGKESGWGLAGFPVALEPGDWGRFKKLGLEVGLLVTPHSRCDADLEVIALFDLLEYVPSMKPPLEAAKAAAAAAGIDLKCGLGIDVSGTVHLCRDEQGNVTSDSAKVCGGLFIACGVGLSDKGAGRGQHPVPAAVPAG